MTLIITGSAGGIGHACMTSLCREGKSVRGLDIAAQSEGAPPGANVETIDVRDEALFAAALGESGCVHGLVSCAALLPAHPDPYEILETNFVAAVQNVEAILPTAGAGAAVVLFSSIAAFRLPWSRANVDSYAKTGQGRAALDELLQRHRPRDGYEGYCLSKRLIYDFTPAIAKRAAARGVRVNCLVLGPTETPAALALQRAAPDAWQKLVGECPLGAPVELAEVTAMVSLLLSSRMRHLTGARISLDGGWSAVHDRLVAGETGGPL